MTELINELEERTDEEILKMTEDDIINKLIGQELEAPTKQVILERLGIPIILKGLSEKEINGAMRECTRRQKVKGKYEEVLDKDELNAVLIKKATVTPNWDNEKLLAAKKVSSGDEYIRRVLLGGETAKLGEIIMDLSGFNDGVDEVETVKN